MSLIEDLSFYVVELCIEQKLNIAILSPRVYAFQAERIRKFRILFSFDAQAGTNFYFRVVKTFHVYNLHIVHFREYSYIIGRHISEEYVNELLLIWFGMC